MVRKTFGERRTYLFATVYDSAKLRKKVCTLGKALDASRGPNLSGHDPA